MKKLILFLLLPLWVMAQTTTGQEQEFDYGIKNNSTQTITTPPYLTTTGMDGTQGKIPSALIEKTDNKQNSLTVDGTGTKYPTVDAVNTGLALKALDSNVIHKTGNETKTGTLTINNPVGGGSYFIGTQSGSGNDRFLIKLFNNGSVNSSALKIDNQSDAYGINLVNVGTGIGSYIGNNSYGTGFKIDNSSIGVGLILNNEASATGYPFVITKNNIVKSYINDSGDVNGVKFVKTGGTSSQFLKADGSIDSTVYAPSTGGTGYIQNQNSVAQSANMWISGSCKFESSNSTDQEIVSIKNNANTGGVTSAKLNFYNYNGTSVLNAAGIRTTSNSWYYGQVQPNQLNIISYGNGGTSFHINNSSNYKFMSSASGDETAWVQLLGINGTTGAATFASTVTASPATLSNHVVVKSQLDAVGGLKQFKAVVNQIGSNAPTFQTLRNTTGIIISMTYVSVGVYQITATSATWQNGSTFISICNGTIVSNEVVRIKRLGTATIEVRTFVNNVATNDVLKECSLNIESY